MPRFLPSSARVAAKYFGGSSAPAEWSLDSPLLPWSPIEQSSPTVINVTTSAVTQTFADDEDGLIVMPNYITNQNITLTGGRHIRIIGGHMGTGRLACYQFTGSLFVEGLVIDLTDRVAEGDAIQIGGKEGLPERPNVTFQNMALLGVHGTNLSWNPTAITSTIVRTNGNADAVVTMPAHRCAIGELARLYGGSKPSMKGQYKIMSVPDADTLNVRDVYGNSLASYPTLTSAGMTGYRFNVYENDPSRPAKTITSIVRTASGTTITTTTPHGMSVGRRCVVTGSTNLDETYWVRSVPNTTSFTVNDYSNTGSVTGSDQTGTGGTMQPTRVDSGNHADGIQPQDYQPIGALRMARMTIDSNYQGVILGHNTRVDGGVRIWGNTSLEMYGVNFKLNDIEPRDANSYQLYLKGNEEAYLPCPCILNEVFVPEHTENGYRFRAEQFSVKPWEGYLSPTGDDWGARLSDDGTSITWAPAAGISGTVYIGRPLGGDYAKPCAPSGQGGLGIAGWGYISPGYFGY
jgi:hypothetical protein